MSNGPMSTQSRLADAVVGLMMLGSLAFGHGVRHQVFSGGTGIEASYDDGSPMAFCDVTVFAPNDQDNEYQTGTTDPHGRFVFAPDTNDVWTLSVDDGMGHLVTAEVQAGPNELVDGGADTRVDRLTGGMVGVSVIFGLFGVYHLARQGKGRSGPGSSAMGGESECTSPKV